ncbi:RHS repeat-associated core domain-containing protein [Pseudomonas maumuensis]|uniref:RHS repeat-associated core domain-containing protein n=1 Tax=Pseudomonas maumuensis TaxID=2842354 RepID=A0ABX8NLR0_9PSED|nr:RHS repeat-associated core domain-containing protein [Pseudomonas maumuensis]QXH56969.1 RHS repeat-associated core domain-containing protein [Pseudomonas maumuensis]
MAQQYKLKSGISLLASDMQGSILLHRQLSDERRLSYAPYGGFSAVLTKPLALGFNAQLREDTGHYLLGNGYRVFNPQLMRFISADHLSPFGGGGINSYMYCSGDPINNIDPSGHVVIKRPLGHLLDPIGIDQGRLFESFTENGKRMLNANKPVKLGTEYKEAISKGINESNALIEKFNRYNSRAHAQQYIAQEKQVETAQKTMARSTGSDRGERAHYNRASEAETTAQSQMKFLRAQYNFIGDWLELRAIQPSLQSDISKANQVLRLGES